MLQSPPRVFIANEAVTFAELDDEAVLLNLDSGIYFGLDAVGTSIWKLLSQGGTEDDVVRGLLQTYEVDEETLRSDLADFLDLLASKGLALVLDR